MRVIFKLHNTIQVFTLASSRNSKIVDSNEKIIQTYVFSFDQYNYLRNCVKNNQKASMLTFFSLDEKNCFDCPFSSNSGNGKCYTHKFMQYTGFISTIKSLIKEFDTINNIAEYNNELGNTIVQMSENRYVRFGTYGEPSLHPIELVEQISNNCKNWTGYTHQWFKKPEYSLYFMASTHNKEQAKRAKEKFSYRSFISVDNKGKLNGVICPASKEQGKISNCAKCGLCSGTKGKGKKDIVILEH